MLGYYVHGAESEKKKKKKRSRKRIGELSVHLQFLSAEC